VFAEKISRTLGLQLERVYPQTSKIAQRDIRGHFLYASDPDLCCELNKVEPLNAIIANYDVWVNGVRRDQSKARSELQSFEKTINGCTRYHPMLDWTAKEIYYYRQCYELDEHPLESAGFQSIGCQPCTSIRNPCSSERQSRWFGMNKTECGLNTTLIAKS
jgi:phosphoadenosine phosphosulfate reductase